MNHKVVIVAMIAIMGVVVWKRIATPAINRATVKALGLPSSEEIGEFETELSEQDQFRSIYARLGLSSGDLLKEINGVAFNTEGFFQTLIKGFRDGHVCVLFERASQKREVCFDKTSRGEKVVDRLLREPTTPIIEPSVVAEVPSAPEELPTQTSTSDEQSSDHLGSLLNNGPQGNMPVWNSNNQSLLEYIEAAMADEEEAFGEADPTTTTH